MNFLTMLQQLFNNSCSGGACQAAAQTAASTAGGLSGETNMFTTLCRLFGLGC